MGRKYVRISLGGARDEADIRGHRRTYVGAMAGRIIQGMKQAGTKNPVFLLDEIDKLGVSYQGDPASALLEVLDPAQNDSFTDHYLGVPFDLSEVLFIATANFLQGIPGPLLDRMETVEFSGYTEPEKLAIARQYLVPRQLAENALTGEQLVLSDGAIAAVVTGYTREAGVRQLERELGPAGAQGRAAHRRPRSRAGGAGSRGRGRAARPAEGAPGAGGARGSGRRGHRHVLHPGGRRHHVRRGDCDGRQGRAGADRPARRRDEGVGARRLTYARSHAAIAGHRGEGLRAATCTSTCPPAPSPRTARRPASPWPPPLVSALSRRPARHDVAMTGEITLSGRVLPIGGVKEKVLGAVRAGITTILLPKENEADLEDLPAGRAGEARGDRGRGSRRGPRPHPAGRHATARGG